MICRNIQIMGFNFDVCGFKDVDSFVKEFWISEKRQLEMFCLFIQGSPVLFHSCQEACNPDSTNIECWYQIACQYNGKANAVVYGNILHEHYNYFIQNPSVEP